MVVSAPTPHALHLHIHDNTHIIDIGSTTRRGVREVRLAPPWLAQVVAEVLLAALAGYREDALLHCLRGNGRDAPVVACVYERGCRRAGWRRRCLIMTSNTVCILR